MRLPMPGMANMLSMTTSPEIRKGMDMKVRTTTSIRELRRTCFTITDRLGNPFAYAVSTYLSRKTSIASDLVNRRVRAIPLSTPAVTGRI